MTDYSKMSDAELSAEILKVKHGAIGVIALREDGAKLITLNDTHSLSINNQSDMWPLIVDNKIDICHIDSHEIWKAFAIKDGEIVSHEDKNPLRAAAIVFLMLNED